MMTTHRHETADANTEVPPPRVIVIGNLTIDDVVYPDGTTSMGSLGGNTVYASIAAAIWGVSVGVVARFGEDFPRFAFGRLRGAGVDTEGLRAIAGPTVNNWVIYENDGHRTWVYRTPHRAASRWLLNPRTFLVLAWTARRAGRSCGGDATSKRRSDRRGRSFGGPASDPYP